jgi:hypothetical protein
MKYEVSFYGKILVEADDEEDAVSKATSYMNENPREYCSVKKI